MQEQTRGAAKRRKPTQGRKSKLTKRTVEGLRPSASGELVVFDSELPGFGIRVFQSGKKNYFVQFRNAQRRLRWVTLGTHGILTAEQARQRARELLADARDGRDPAEVRDSFKTTPTVAEFADSYLQNYAIKRKKPKSIAADKRMIEQRIIPAIGRRKIDEVTRQDIVRLHSSLSDTPILANRVLALLSKTFNLAEDWGCRVELSNPCRRIEKYPERKHERFLSVEEFKRLGDVLAEVETTRTESPQVIAAIKLLIFTGCRRDEILTLRRKDVDLERGVLQLPDAKTGSSLVFLNQPAIEVLKGLVRRLDSLYVIPGKKFGSHLVNLQKPWIRIREKAGLSDVRLHDLRHSFASFAAGLGVSLLVIGKLLGHTQAVTTQRYAHLANHPLKQASDEVGQALRRALDGP